MVSHSLKSLGYFLALTFLVLSPALAAAQAAPAARGVDADQPPANWDIFVGYSFLAPHGSVTSPYSGGPYSYDNINVGGILSVARYFNRHVGIEFVGDVHSEDQNPNGSGFNNSNDDLSGGSLGVIYRFPRANFTPFVHALVGGERVGGPNDQADTWGPVITGGGGLDYVFPFWNRHLAYRIFQADYQYVHVNFGDTYYGGVANINAARLSTGLVFHPGVIIPPAPVILSCVANPNTVFPGDPVTITATPGELNPKLNAIYSWSGQGVTGNGTTATVATGALAPGVYQVQGTVKEGKPGKEGLKPGQSATCTAGFTVKAFEPPTISCSASPTTINPGDSSTVTAQGVSPQNRPLTYTYSATAGTITGNGASATYSSANAATGAVGITCTVTDDKGQTATAQTGVTIAAPPLPPTPKTQALCTLSYATDSMHPTRVSNEAKACLDQVALDLQNQADAKAVIVGESNAKEKTPRKGRHAVQIDFAAQRAVNAKDYLVTEKGIDASRISVATGTTDGQTVEDYLVPAGATFTNDVQGTTPVDETAIKAQPRKPLGARRHHHRKPAAQQ